MKDWEMLMQRIENQISNMFDTILEIEELQQEEPLRMLSNQAQIELCMAFNLWVLSRSIWYNIFKDKFTKEQKLKYIQEVIKMTKEHYKNLYWFDIDLISKNIKWKQK